MRDRFQSCFHRFLLAVGAVAACGAWADDSDALGLKSEEPAEVQPAVRPLRLVTEAAFGRVGLRLPVSGVEGRRLSVDLRVDTAMAKGWRFRLSDRIDYLRPALGDDDTVNSLRELHVSWQQLGGSDLVDLGRVNLRQGVALGYSPTDFLRTGGLRIVTTADPVTLREQRLGTFMLRYSRLWDGGSLTAGFAPRLADNRPASAWSVDSGATNHAHRAWLSLGLKPAAALSTLATLLWQRGATPRLGLSASALAHDAVVLYAEAAVGRMALTVDSLKLAPEQRKSRQQVVAGATVSLPGALSVTLEMAHSGAGLDSAGWAALGALGPSAVQGYLALAQRDQELAGRKAWLLYWHKTGLAGWGRMELKGFVRVSTTDSSRLVWLELRHRWPQWDLALQWQRSTGGVNTEFGGTRYRQVTQLLGACYW